MEYRWRHQDSAEYELRDIHRSALQQRQHDRWNRELRSADRRNIVLGQAAREKKWPASRLAISFPATECGLLHRVHHVEYRKVHRHDHAADDDAEEYDHDRLEQREQIAHSGIDFFVVEISDLGQHLI